MSRMFEVTDSLSACQIILVLLYCQFLSIIALLFQLHIGSNFVPDGQQSRKVSKDQEGSIIVMMNQNDLNEWKKDIGEAEHSYPHFANGPFLRALFKTTQEISSVSQQVMHLSTSVDSANKQLASLTKNLRAASESSDKHSNAMKYLTFGLVFLGLVQVVVAGLSYWDQNQEVQTRKSCFQSVLQTSDIDLNYKNCLRDNGLTE